MATTTAEHLIDTLVEAGVKHLFTLSGNQILDIYDATIGRNIDLIHTRHEAAAVHMADGWGRLTEEPGVALLTAGPGHCNALTGLYVALMSESPLVLLSGHCPTNQIGKGAFQEMDQVGLARPVAKAAWLVERAEDLNNEITRALHLAGSGRPGPVHLSLPNDILPAAVAPAPLQLPPEDAGPLDEALITQTLDLLAGARHPLLLAGPAMKRPHRWSAVEQLAQTTAIPALPMESPRGINDPWLHQATNCLERADLVLLAGKKLDFTLRFGQSPFFSHSCRFIQIDADPEQLSQDPRVVLRINAEPTRVLDQLQARAMQREWPDSSWPEEVETARLASSPAWDALAHSSQQPIHPLRLCQALQPFLDDDAIFVSDGGEIGQWAQAGLEARDRLINGPAGSIGSSLPLGLAAKLAYPQRPVLVVLGDGTLGYHLLEFDTALRYNLPVIAIVGNDARWNAEYQLQIQNYGADRLVGCELWLSRYDKMVEALGGHGEFVERPEDLTPALERAVASGRPACVNVSIEGAGAPTFR